jgi:hypothetical protein
VADLDYQDGLPKLTNIRHVLDKDDFEPPARIIETQNFIPPDDRAITVTGYQLGMTNNTDAFVFDLETKKLTNITNSPEFYDGCWESNRPRPACGEACRASITARFRGPRRTRRSRRRSTRGRSRCAAFNGSMVRIENSPLSPSAAETEIADRGNATNHMASRRLKESMTRRFPESFDIPVQPRVHPTGTRFHVT